MDLIYAILSIVLIDLVLSGDNAAVIGLAIKDLPEQMRKSAAALGAGGAVVLRIIFTSLATLLINIPYLNAIGGIILIWITWNLLHPNEDASSLEATNQYWVAVRNIIIADVSMAFDNIMGVAGAAHGSIGLVIFGLAVSIPILVWGSSWLARLMNRFPLIIYIGGAVLAHTAITMILRDNGLNVASVIGELSITLIGIGVAIAVIVYGLFRLKSFDPSHHRH